MAAILALLHFYVVFCGEIREYRVLEELVRQVPDEKILFGSDTPWMDPRSHLSRALLAGIEDSVKEENPAR